MLAEGEPEDPARARVKHRVQVELALSRPDLGAVAVPPAVDPVGRELAPDQVRCPPPAFPRPGSALAALPAGAGGQALLTHQGRDGVLAHPPARLAQRGGDPRRPVLAPALREQPRDLGFQPLAARRPRPQAAIPPLVKPGPGHPQRPAAGRVRDAALVPLGSDERGHGYLLPIASETQRATLRLSTSHRIASSAFSLRSRASSARSPSLSCPSPPSRRRRSAPAQFPRVPAFIPRSRATCATGLPVSRTSRTAPARKSRSNFLRVSPIGDTSL